MSAEMGLLDYERARNDFMRETLQRYLYAASCAGLGRANLKLRESYERERVGIVWLSGESETDHWSRIVNNYLCSCSHWRRVLR